MRAAAWTSMMKKALGVTGVMAVMACVTGCTASADAELAPCGERMAAPAVTEETTVAVEPRCELPVLFDGPVETTGTCAANDVALARQLRSHVAQTSSFVALGSVLLHDVLFDAIVGRALENVDLGSWDEGLDYEFDAATGEYKVTARTGLVIGNEHLGEWDAKNAQAEIRFRLYRAGQPILADAFDLDSYLVNPSVDVDVFDARVSVAYDAAGPLVSIFGWGEHPKNPAVVRVSDVARVQENVRALEADVRIVLRIGQPDCASATIELTTARKTLEEWATSPDPELHIVVGSGVTGELTLRRSEVVPAMSLSCE